jgi:hypothetical protein
MVIWTAASSSTTSIFAKGKTSPGAAESTAVASLAETLRCRNCFPADVPAGDGQKAGTKRRYPHVAGQTG